jgi:flagellar assembly protein FliH
MSSRVLMRDDPRPVEQFVWRQAHTPPSRVEQALPASAAADPAPAERLRREWEQRVADAHAAGQREGEAAGRARAAAEMESALGRLAATLDELAALRARLRREAEADTVKLAIAIARRVIRRELAVDPEALHGLVLAALEKLQGQEICRVRVHPQHVAAIAALLRKSAGGAVIEVLPDASRDPGAALFETDRGNLDASVESQLGEIERGLADTLRKQR